MAVFVDTVRDWLSSQLGGAGALQPVAAGGAGNARLGGLAQAWEDVDRAARDAEAYNLERKPLVFKVFGWLAAAVRD